ncbi:MAG: hypothetical protein GY796_18925 [Chloroflexi bacterium]|nr:hypothetical protein [Chloroflexota bacterium]
MSRTESWKTWMILVILLLIFGAIAAIWPTLSVSLNLGSGSGSSTAIPYESHPIVINIPVTTLPTGAEVGGQTIVMSPLQALLGVTAVTIGLVLGAGIVLGVLYAFLSRLVSKTEASDSYKEHATALNKKEKEKLKEMQDGRAAAPPNNDGMPRWSVISTDLIILLFVYFGATIVATTFFPERVVEIGNELVAPGLIIVGGPLLITAAILIFAPRWGKASLAVLIMLLVAFVTFALFGITKLTESLSVSQLFNIVGLVEIVTLIALAYLWRPTPADVVVEKIKHGDERGREKGIPYDTIFVLITGLLIVGVGLGLMVLLLN